MRANPFENHRLHSAAITAFTASKPFLAQSGPFSATALLLASQVHKSIDGSHKIHPLDYRASLIRIHHELEGVPESAVLNKMESIFHRDGKDVAAALLLIQIQMQKGSTHAAAVTLEKLFQALRDTGEVKYAPGLVSLAGLLFPQVGKEEKATTLLMDAKTYWSSKETSVCVKLCLRLIIGSQHRPASELCDSIASRQSLDAPTICLTYSRDGRYAVRAKIVLERSPI